MLHVYSKDTHRFAVAGSISKRSARNLLHLKVGDTVNVNPIMRDPGWKTGEICKLDSSSGQIQVIYTLADKTRSYWTHLDNIGEITAPNTPPYGNWVVLRRHLKEEKEYVVHQKNLEELTQWEPIKNETRKTLTVDPVFGDAVITRSGLIGIARYVVCFLTLNYRGHKA